MLTADQISRAIAGFDESLRRRGVEPDQVDSGSPTLARLSSTAGAGGVLDVFWDPWKLEAAVANECAAPRRLC